MPEPSATMPGCGSVALIGRCPGGIKLPRCPGVASTDAGTAVCGGDGGSGAPAPAPRTLFFVSADAAVCDGESGSGAPAAAPRSLSAVDAELAGVGAAAAAGGSGAPAPHSTVGESVSETAETAKVERGLETVGASGAPAAAPRVLRAAGTDGARESGSDARAPAPRVLHPTVVSGSDTADIISTAAPALPRVLRSVAARAGGREAATGDLLPLEGGVGCWEGADVRGSSLELAGAPPRSRSAVMTAVGLRDAAPGVTCACGIVFPAFGLAGMMAGGIRDVAPDPRRS